MCLNPSDRKDNRGVLGASFRVEQLSVVGYSNMADYTSIRNMKNYRLVNYLPQVPGALSIKQSIPMFSVPPVILIDCYLSQHH